MNNFIELHLWDMDENKRNTPVLVNVGTIAQVMIDYKAPTIIYFGTYDHITDSLTAKTATRTASSRAAFGACWDAETELCRNSFATAAKEGKARMKNDKR